MTEHLSPAAGSLWLVATPIGTIDDLGARARRILGEVDLILAEDTRHARKLLARAGITTRARLRSLHEHNETGVTPKVLAALQEGRSAALVSDAGTPVLSDPGFVLVREARRLGLPVLSVPGASSFSAALAASGQPPLPATLIGFLPSRSGPRRRRIGELAGVSWTLVVLLSPHRLPAELRDLADGLGRERPATLLAELSKLHERAIMADLGQLADCTETKKPRGEYVLVIGPEPVATEPAEVSRQVIQAEYDKGLAAGRSRRQALRDTADRLGLRRRDVYSSLFVDRDEFVDRDDEK